MRNALRVTVSTFGGLTGLIGMEHGIGEMLQGSTAPEGLMILSWPNAEFFRVLGGEPAMTVIPNMLVSGILATIVSLIYAVWAVFLVQRRHSSAVMMGLSALMLLVGGGIFPPVLAFLTGAAAAGINAPADAKGTSTRLHRFFHAVWPWAYGASLLSWLAMFPGVPVLSSVFGVENDLFILTVIGCMFGFLLLAWASSTARDSGRASA